jgi:hypothetical protein
VQGLLHLGNLYRARGLYRQAEAPLRRALATALRELGPDDLPPGDIHAMGKVLAKVAQLCLDAGATPVLCHHSIKRPLHPYEPMELEDLSGAAFAEFARQWILLSRRQAFEAGKKSLLWVNVGGSAGFSGLYPVDVDEGYIPRASVKGNQVDFSHKKWEVTIGAESLADAHAKRQERKWTEDEAKILRALDKHDKGEGVVKSRLVDFAGLSGSKGKDAINRLEAAGVVDQFESTVVSGNGARTRCIRVRRAERSDRSDNGPTSRDDRTVPERAVNDGSTDSYSRSDRPSVRGGTVRPSQKKNAKKDAVLPFDPDRNAQRL